MRNRLLTGCAILLPWAMLCWHLSGYWSLSPQYQYGWLVPPLAAYLFFRRWQALPESTPSDSSLATALEIVCALLLLPLWLLRTATPDWCVLSYCLVAAVTGLTLALLATMMGWRRARWLAFPVVFIFCAVPWPQRLETWAIQSLMRVVAGITTELMQWFGIAAEQRGNLVFLGHDAVDVSEACSGVRSLQSMLMASLFLGELRRLKAVPRATLVVAGIGLALFFNVARNSFLTLLVYYSGSAALEKWHDSAGWTILLLSFACLLLIAKKFGKTVICEAGAPACSKPLSAGFSVFLTAWFVLVIAGNEFWYQFHERNSGPAQHLVIRWPNNEAQFHAAGIPDRARDLTLCTEARTASWTGEDGQKWILTSLRWAPGRTASQSARVHQPDVCLRAVGAIPLQEFSMIQLPVAGGDIFFRIWLFSYESRPLFVFYSLWEDANRDQSNPALRQDWSAWSRIQRAFIGQRNLGQQSIEIALQGYGSQQEAVRALRSRLPSLLSIEPGLSGTSPVR